MAKPCSVQPFDKRPFFMHDSCMATKTISIEIDAYEKLKAEKRPGESFSQVVRRAFFGPKRGITASDYLEHGKRRGVSLDPLDCDDIDRLNAEDLPPDVHQ
jgi:predicted CopG family antitoxin